MNERKWNKIPIDKPVNKEKWQKEMQVVELRKEGKTFQRLPISLELVGNGFTLFFKKPIMNY